MLLQVVHHRICDAWVDDVVSASIALCGDAAFHVLHDGILHVECCGEHSRGQAMTSLQLLEVRAIPRRHAVQL